MAANSKWQVTKDENGNNVHTWKDYEVKKVDEWKVVAANYLNPKEPPTYGWVSSWKAIFWATYGYGPSSPNTGPAYSSL